MGNLESVGIWSQCVLESVGIWSTTHRPATRRQGAPVATPLGPTNQPTASRPCACAGAMVGAAVVLDKRGKYVGYPTRFRMNVEWFGRGWSGELHASMHTGCQRLHR